MLPLCVEGPSTFLTEKMFDLSFAGTPRSNSIPRWSTPLFTLDQEDFSMITHQSNAEPNAIILMDEATAAATSTEHTGQCCNSGNLICDTDRFFQAGDALEGSGSRDNDQLPTPKSP